jgi:hypothetical protein
MCPIYSIVALVINFIHDHISTNTTTYTHTIHTHYTHLQSSKQHLHRCNIGNPMQSQHQTPIGHVRAQSHDLYAAPIPEHHDTLISSPCAHVTPVGHCRAQSHDLYAERIEVVQSACRNEEDEERWECGDGEVERWRTHEE